MLNSVLKKESMDEVMDPMPQAKRARASTFWPRSSSGSGVNKIPIIAATKTEL
jgi:hypothetical protein